MSSRRTTRREFIQYGAVLGSSLVVPFHLPSTAKVAGTGEPGGRPEPFKPNAWLEVGADDSVRIWTGRSEMGQGVMTALPMIVAEELSADWESVAVVQADADQEFGTQTTTASRSVSSGWLPLRQAGAAAREMLVAAAARTWQVPTEECRAESGSVRHPPTGRVLRYGQLVDRARLMEAPEAPRLKDRSDFTIVGTRVPRVDVFAKVTGAAVFGLDVRLPGMVYAAVARPPVFGARIMRYDATPALAVPGVIRVVQLSFGVAVVARNTWAAFRGQDALAIEWSEGDSTGWSSARIDAALAEAASGPGNAVRDLGNVEQALGRAATTLEATYQAPYLTHACMEPMNCTARVWRDRCEVWAPTQNPQGVRREAAKVLGLPESAVTVHVTFLGGGFGRRGPVDYATEAVELAAKLDHPVQLAWTREDDISKALYRPASYHHLRAGLDGNGRPIAWHHRLSHPHPRYFSPGAESFMIVRGADQLDYRIPNHRLELATADPGIPWCEWRGVGPSHNSWVIESFIDELALAAARDPYQYRREIAADNPRLVAVLDAAAQKAGWGSAAPPGRFRGLAMLSFHETCIAEVAEVSVNPEGKVRVHRVVAAIDCGIVVNPNILEAQVESGIVFGLSAALYGEITIDDGRVRQSNFHDYPVLMMSEMPQIEVVIVESDREPSGAGEAAVPALAPALCNAVYVATGKRIRKLPLGTVSG